MALKFIQENKRSLFLLFWTVFIPFMSTGQGSDIYLDEPDKLVEYANHVYGSNDLLITGRIYVPQHSLAEGHPYFGIADWILGDVYVRSDRFENQKLKYDIELDEFILYIEDAYQRKNYLVLNHHYVDSIYLGKFLFVNTAVVPRIGGDIGYAELVYNKRMIFLVKYKKDFKKEYSDAKPYGEYAEQTSERYICEGGRMEKVTSKKSFLHYFEQNQKEIKRYLKKEKIKYKKANSGELYNLINFCDALQHN